MRRLALLVALLPAAVGLVPAARGEDPAPRELGFPREGFSVVVPAGWTFSQPVSALFEAGDGPNATVWFRRDTGKGDDLAGRLRDLVARMAGESPGVKAPEPEAWKVKAGGESFRVEFPQGEKHVHGFALVSQPMGRRLEVEWVRRAAAGAPSHVQALLDSLDVTPYAHASRYVDWTAGWSIDVPAGWKRVAATDGRTVFEGDGALSVRAAPNGGTAEDLAAELKALTARDPALAPVGEPAVATRMEGGQPLTRYGRLLRRREGAPDPAATHALVVEARDAYLVGHVALLGEGGADPDQWLPSAFERTLPRIVPRADPGPRATAAPEESFARADAPKVVFRAPTRWKKVPTSPGMRLAQWEVPGAEPAECVVFFFGATQGGSLDANLKRWKGQFELEGAAQESTEEVSPGVFATVLDVSGRYVAPVMPGKPETHDKPGWRMLAAVVLAPDGPLYLKLVGPKATVDPAADEFRAWVRSFRVKP